MFHRACWDTHCAHHAGSHEGSLADLDCPVCRGKGVMLAHWEYVDPKLVTQPNGEGGQVNPMWSRRHDGNPPSRSRNMPSNGATSSGSWSQVGLVSEHRLPSNNSSPRRRGREAKPPTSNINLSAVTGYLRNVLTRRSRTDSPSFRHPEQEVPIPSARGANSPPRPEGEGDIDIRMSDSGATVMVILPNTWLDVETWSNITDHFIPSDNTSIKQVPINHESLSGASLSFHSMTRLTDGRLSMLLDIGSVGNLTGELTAREMAKAALKANRTPSQYQRAKPLNVSGVGKGSEQCHHNCKLPVSLNKAGGGSIKANFDTPIIPGSELPALLGLDTVRGCRGIIDTNTLRLYLLGPGDYDLSKALPPGTECIQGELAPSGHFVIPCDSFDQEDTDKGGIETPTAGVSLPVSVNQSP